MIKGLEEKWDEKSQRQEAIIAKLETQLTNVTELLTTTLQSAESSEREGSLKDKQDEVSQTDFPKDEEKEEVVVLSEIEYESASPVAIEVEEKEKIPAWEATVEKLTNVTIEGFERLGKQIEKTMKPSTPIELVNEIKVRSNENEANDKDTSASTSHKEEVVQKEPFPEVVKPTVKPYVPPIPFPGWLRKRKEDEEHEKFLDVFKKLEVNIPLTDALKQVPHYERYLKEVTSKKRKMSGREIA